MPQMAPLWWEWLFIMFSMMFFTMNVIIYHIPNIKTKNTKKLKNINQMNWKW